MEYSSLETKIYYHVSQSVRNFGSRRKNKKEDVNYIDLNHQRKILIIPIIIFCDLYQNICNIYSKFIIYEK